MPKRSAVDKSRSPLMAVVGGMVITIVLAFPVAGLFALVYRFPVAFVGYVSGARGFGEAMLGVFFWGIIGGFAVLAGLGAIAGAGAHKYAKNVNWSPTLETLLIIGLCCAVNLAVGFMMATVLPI